jgi:hypothetical protein
MIAKVVTRGNDFSAAASYLLVIKFPREALL